MPDYIPRPDGHFSSWANQYADALATWWDASGLDPADLDALKDALEAWNKAYGLHVAAQAAAEAARDAKDAARGGLERAARPLANFVQSYPKTTNTDRAQIGITVRSRNATPSPVPTTRPQVRVTPTNRLTHELRVTDEGSPTRRAKPEGVAGAEIWLKLVAPGQPVPTDPDALSYLTLTTRPTLRTDFQAADGGKTAVYMLRWVSTRGEKGPWSEIATATVAA